MLLRKHVNLRDEQEAGCWCLAIKIAVVCGIVSFMLLTICIIGYAWSIQPQNKHIVEKKWSGSTFKLHRGLGYVDKDQLIITGTGSQKRVRIISELTPFKAKDFQFMVWDFAKIGPRTGMFVGWITKQNPGKLNTIPAIIPLDNKVVYRMHSNQDWQDEIIALGLGFEGQMYEAVHLTSVSVKPYSILLFIESLWDEWTAFRSWDQRTINSITIGAKSALIKPVPLIAAWLMLSIGIYSLMTIFIGTLVRKEVCLILVFFGWLIVDALWQVNILNNNNLSYQLYAGKKLEEKILSGVDASLYELTEKAKKCSKQNQKITFPSNDLYMSQKARYFLLPMQIKNIYPWTVNEIFNTCFLLTSDMSKRINAENKYLQLKGIIDAKGIIYYSNEMGVIYAVQNRPKTIENNN